MRKYMDFTLTCVCCGSSQFKLKKLPLSEIEGDTYLVDRKDGKYEDQVICSKCGLEDYIDNLIPKVEMKTIN